MRTLILLILCLPGVLRAADLCEEPVNAICEGSLVGASLSDDQVQSEISKLLGADAKPSHLTGEVDQDQAELAQFQKHIGAAYQVILGHYAEHGVSEVDLVQRVSQIREQAAQDFAQGRLGPSVAETGPTSNAGIADNIRKIKYLSPRILASLDPKNPKDQDTIESYYESCGADGLSDQAFYEPSENRFILCPGALIEALNDGGLDALNHEMGHELTHSADAFTDPSYAGKSDEWKEGDAPLYGKYSGFLSCIQANYATQFADPQAVMNEMKGPSKDRLKALLSSLQAQPGDQSSEISRIELYQRKTDSLAEELKGLADANPKNTGHALTLADSHAGELTADLGGHNVIKEFLRRMPPDQRALALTKSMRTYCPMKMDTVSQALYGDLRDDGLHPPEEFRVGNVLNDPEIRLLLGCRSLAGPGPWCDARIGKPIAARCSGPETNLQDCEKQMSAQLQATGCQFQKIQCELNNNAVGCITQSTNCELATNQSGKLTCTEKEFPTLLKEGSPIPGLCLAGSPVQGPPKSGAQ